MPGLRGLGPNPGVGKEVSFSSAVSNAKFAIRGEAVDIKLPQVVPTRMWLISWTKQPTTQPVRPARGVATSASRGTDECCWPGTVDACSIAFEREASNRGLTAPHHGVFTDHAQASPDEPRGHATKTVRDREAPSSIRGDLVDDLTLSSDYAGQPDRHAPIQPGRSAEGHAILRRTIHQAARSATRESPP